MYIAFGLRETGMSSHRAGKTAQCALNYQPPAPEAIVNSNLKVVHLMGAGQNSMTIPPEPKNTRCASVGSENRPTE